jgi:gluconolactonase
LIRSDYTLRVNAIGRRTMTARRYAAILCATGLILTLGAAVPKSDVKPVRLLTLPEYTEGVVFDRDGNGYISHGKTIGKFTIDGKHETWLETGGPNGHKILPDGTHLVCDRSHRTVLRISKDGKLLGDAVTTYNGKRFEGPNDLTIDVKNDGFYFTDPENSTLENPIGAVYHVSSTDGQGAVTQVDKGMAYPNGVALTPDGKKLYVGESLTNRVYVYEVISPGRVGPRRILAELPKADKSQGQTVNMPDGMCLDAQGNLYVAHFGMHQVEAVSPEGKLIASLQSGNLTTSNVAFGGPNRDQLFVTGALGGLGESQGAVFRLDIGVKGLDLLAAPEKSPEQR